MINLNSEGEKTCTLTDYLDSCYIYNYNEVGSLILFGQSRQSVYIRKWEEEVVFLV
jgi:hypothetical protein